MGAANGADSAHGKMGPVADTTDVDNVADREPEADEKEMTGGGWWPSARW